MSTPAPRTLADQLRSWSAESLTELLVARPDLAVPAPQDSGQLASRASTRASVVLALDQLTLLELTVVDAVVACGGTADLALLRVRVNATPVAVTAAVERLRGLALLWGPPGGELRAISILTDLVGTSISGLGSSAATLLSGYGPNKVAALARDLGLTPTGDRHSDIEAVTEALSSAALVEELLGEIDDRARAILDHLEREGTNGSVESADRQVSRKDVVGPVDQLLARGLLIACDRRHVTVPREVAICLRAGMTTRTAADDIPGVATSERPRRLVDSAAAGAAFEAVRHLELLLEHWGAVPPAALRAGGLSVRDLRATAELLHVTERVAALYVELAHDAGLVAVGPAGDTDAAWVPTDTFDAWSTGTVAQRWARIALAWLAAPRLTALVGTREAGKPVNALSPDLARPWLPETRRLALDELALLPEDQVLASGTGIASLVARLRWLRPRRPAQRAEAVGWVVEESAVLGITGLGGLSTHGQALLAPAHSAPATVAEKAAKALEPLLPSPVDHILLQADLTAVAPGPLEQELARDLATVADIESRGGATVYRFTSASLRRAYDSGWSTEEVRDFITRASRTPVPQALSYLVDDVSRKFGTIRIGTAECFLRSDDEAALTQLVHDSRTAALRLRRIAPTVVVSDVPVDVLLPRLRELGAAPVVESVDGTVRVAKRLAYRARASRPARALVDVASPADPRAAARFAARVSSVVTAIRAGDQTVAHRPADPMTRSNPMSTLVTLREAAEAGSTVWIGYVDNHGSTMERMVDPVRVEGGWLSAYDHRSEEVRSFAVHRISGARVSGPSRPPTRH